MKNISKHAIVLTEDIGVGVDIREFAVIREGVKLGNNVIIHPHVVIESGVTIADDVEIFPGAYIGKTPKGAGVLSRTPEFNKSVTIGENSSVGVNAVIYYDVIIGACTLIGDGASLRENTSVGSKTIIGRYVTVNYNTKIGSNVKIMDHTWLAGNMTVGNDVFISGCVGTSNDNAMGDFGYDPQKVVGPYIDDGANIGLGASLLPNVHVGKAAVVGAGSVVTKDVPDRAIAMGVPARVVRYRQGE